MGKFKLIFPTRLLSLTVFVFSLISFQAFAQNSVFVPAISKQDMDFAAKPGSTVLPKYRELPERLLYLVPSDQQGFMPSPSIVGGTTASRGEFPEFAQVWLDGQDGYVYAICGGTLIASNKVLTAAHCAAELTNLYYTTPGFYSFDDYLTADDFYALSGKNQHPQYNPSTLDYDIAIFTLSRTASMAKASIYGGAASLAGQTSTVIGTGLLSTSSGTLPPTLQKVDTPIVTNSVCNAYYDLITDRMICAGYSNSGLGSCNGDSGGPLWTQINGQRTQVGTVSFGTQTCETPGAYSVYARTSALVSFIRRYAPNAKIIGDSVDNDDDDDDDILLMVVPAIAAPVNRGAPPPPPNVGLEKVKLLHGHWKFYFARDDFNSTDYYRFDKSTARVSSDPTIYLINGDSSLFPDFFGNWCDGGMIGSYSTQYNEYLVLCDWGYPTYDTGSAFFFDNVANSFPLVHYWYTPSTGEILNVPYNGNGQKLSSSYSAINIEAESGSIQNNQTLAKQKQVRQEAFLNIQALRITSELSLGKKSIAPDAQRHVQAVSRLLNQNK
jgi:hypothetical protein